jgi:hypothetical protein
LPAIALFAGYRTLLSADRVLQLAHRFAGIAFVSSCLLLKIFPASSVIRSLSVTESSLLTGLK